MKLLLLPFLSGIFIFPANHFRTADKPNTARNSSCSSSPAQTKLQQEPETGKMSCVAFKNQDYCRADLLDFDFDARFTIVSATVYFSGAGFKEIQKGTILGNSLKPVKALMDRSMPGSRIVFDNIKVKGPDNIIRTIQGINLLLY